LRPRPATPTTAGGARQTPPRAWDCAKEGSGIKCPYPTASTDFFAAAGGVWDDGGVLAPGTSIASHGYRGGPFVIDAAEREAALAIIEA